MISPFSISKCINLAFKDVFLCRMNSVLTAPWLNFSTFFASGLFCILYFVYLVESKFSFSQEAQEGT